MVTSNMRKEYEDYIIEHTNNVARGYDWLLINLPELFEGFDADYLGGVIAQHDTSKNSPEEFDAYAEKFYGENKNSKEVKEAFDLAWLHHQNCNKHHWQYWLLQKDSGDLIPQEMSYEYVIEMICDWWSFSWKSNNLYEVFDYYKDHKSTMNLHKNTQQSVEDILDLMKDKLDTLHNKEN